MARKPNKQGKQELLAEIREHVSFNKTGLTGLGLLVLTTSAGLLLLGLAANTSVQSIILLAAIACNLMWGVLVIVGRERRMTIWHTVAEPQ